MSEVTLIVFNGIRFRRYPQATRRSDRVYFSPGIADRQRGVKRLHEEVWISIHGPIPEGYHVHHADHDALNNDPTNLVCIPAGEHRSHHASDTDSKEARRTGEWLDHLEAIRPLAAAWHSSPEGKAWHSEHGRLVMDARPMTKQVCEQCASEFESKNPARFCSNSCKATWRYHAGIDNETRICEHCGTGFPANKYSRRRFCGKSCASKHQHSRT